MACVMTDYATTHAQYITSPALPDPTLNYREGVRGQAHQGLVPMEFPNCAIIA